MATKLSLDQVNRLAHLASHSSDNAFVSRFFVWMAPRLMPRIIQRLFWPLFLPIQGVRLVQRVRGLGAASPNFAFFGLDLLLEFIRSVLRPGYPSATDQLFGRLTNVVGSGTEAIPKFVAAYFGAEISEQTTYFAIRRELINLPWMALLIAGSDSMEV